MNSIEFACDDIASLRAWAIRSDSLEIVKMLGTGNVKVRFDLF